MVQTGKIRTDWRGRFGTAEHLPRRSGVPRILIHAVSVGEINAIRLLVDQLRADKPGIEIVISTTTDTGFARAMTLFGKQCPVVRYPFDFSFAVDRFL
jgi:3-deoxy-D-manno-octulosonic-acid transferase